ncbi:ParB/RepB/Spo0J family partition protein [Candidatus Sneabacter namystus]|uniref:Probable chromosome-partitioning protein ParB n=1 Tax=Candidatus Sneabacter namystus TaxID=2601646 RepID=A0A5C0UJE8_9RICK|nr:ParB/RepB/Spo0J family partition protein [Candidatus Sneabacter namystus]QEK39633.1 ParB/RepB/Spo0J family partition protein [Candidatus Sneabacter namystus]
MNESKTTRLANILGEQIGIVSENPLQYISISLISPNPDQPRKIFSEEQIKELAQSIKQYGVLQPIIVHKEKEDVYTIIAGERRWRACKIAGVKTIPAIVKSDCANRDLDSIALIENIQRQNLKTTEEAKSYASLMEKYGYTQEQLSYIVGKSRSHIANVLRISNLSSKVKEHLDKKEISLGHAKAIAGRKDSDDLVQEIIQKKLSVRETEALVGNKKASEKKAGQKHADNNSDQKVNEEKEKENIEYMLKSKIGLKAELDVKNKTVTFHYHNLDELDLLLAKIDTLGSD